MLVCYHACLDAGMDICSNWSQQQETTVTVVGIFCNNNTKNELHILTVSIINYNYTDLILFVSYKFNLVLWLLTVTTGGHTGTIPYKHVQ